MSAIHRRVELFCTPFTTSVYLSFSFSIVAFCTQQNTVGRYCEGSFWVSNMAQKKQKQKKRHKRFCLFKQNRWRRSVAVVLLTADCLLLPRKIENTSTLSFNLHYRKKKKEKDLHKCVSWAPFSKFLCVSLLSSIVVVYLVESTEFGSDSLYRNNLYFLCWVS